MFPQITMKGTSYEKGFTHGSLCKKQVLVSIDSYKRSFKENKNLNWEDAQKAAQKFLPLFIGKYSCYKEEMQGIADGAGVKFEEILALNCRTEILYSSSCDEDKGCTAFSALYPATKDGICLAGQSWDYTITQREACLIARIPKEDEKPAMLLFLEGGFVGGKGINSAGISITLNALQTDEGTIGIPLHIRMRRVLESTNLSDAFAEAAVNPIPMPANLILTHKDGLSLSLELDPSGCDVILPKNGIIVHTNHFYGPRMILNHRHKKIGSSYIRLQRLKTLMENKKEITVQDMEGFFKDHAGYPYSICVHPSPALSVEKQKTAGATNYVFIADLTNGYVRFAEGNACENEFKTLKIEE